MNLSYDDIDLMYKLWLKASAEECLEFSKNEIKILENKTIFWEIWKNYIKNEKLFYDPNHKFFTEYLEGIDFQSNQLDFLYRPCADYKTFTSGWKLYHNYYNKIINFDNLNIEDIKIKRYVKIKEKFMMKRYYNCFLNKIKVFYFGEKPTVKIYYGDNVNIKYIKVDKNINNLLFNHLEYYETQDLFIFCFENLDEIIIDNFIPVQPLWINESTICLTPILLQQINGFYDIESLYSRIYDEIGSILLTDENIKLPNYTKENIIKGISDFEEGIFKDGRVKRINPNFTKHIPVNGHGWSVSDVVYTIKGVTEYIKPKVVVELGSWHGQSARLFVNNNPNKNFTFYSVDKFTNMALFNTIKYDNINPFYKLSLCHPRYETFASNLSYKKNNFEEKVSRHYFDEPDNNPNKQVIMIKEDVFEGLDILKLNNVKPDIVYIHIVFPETQKMIDLIEKIKTYFPECIITGTNQHYTSNKAALESFNLKYMNLYNESYFISRNKKEFIEISNLVQKFKNIDKLSVENLKIIRELPYINYQKILKNPYMEIYTQAKYLLSNYLKSNKEKDETSIIFEKIINNPKILEDDKIIAPNTYTPFDYYLYNITFE